MSDKIMTYPSEDMVSGFGGCYENEITGLYLSMWLTAKMEAELANEKALFYLNEYRRMRLAELKGKPYGEYLKTKEWQQTRRRALKSAGYKCQLCGTDGVQLHVHHKTYDNIGEEKPDDLIVLCKACHKKQHGKE